MKTVQFIVYISLAISTHEEEYIDPRANDIEAYENYPDNFYGEVKNVMYEPREFEHSKESNKVYIYTKRRNRGHYEELQCDDKSIWTSCVCHFTCAEPDLVDCYYPCEYGCECKDDFVYDVLTRQCILPEQCDYILYD